MLTVASEVAPIAAVAVTAKAPEAESDVKSSFPVTVRFSSLVEEISTVSNRHC